MEACVGNSFLLENSNQADSSPHIYERKSVMRPFITILWDAFGRVGLAIHSR